MKSILSLLTYVLFSVCCFSQGTLYVSESKPNMEINCPNQVYGNYYSFFSLSYTNGFYSIENSSIAINLSFQEEYKEPGNCGGACGNFEYRFTNNKVLDFFEYFISDFTGPSTLTCPWNNYTNNYSDVPIWYAAVLIPDMTQNLELGVCLPLFDTYNDTTYDLTNVGAHWQYFDGSTWRLIPNFYGMFPLHKSIVEIFGENYEDYIGHGETFRLRYTVFQGKYNSTPYTIDIKQCSPELKSTSKSDLTCFDAKDGSISLTFDRNVDQANDYQMRYFVYQGDPADFPSTRLMDADQPIITGIQVFDDPFITLNSNFEGTYSGLEEGSYFIVYQEVNYEEGNATVKSGEITSQFTIESPSQVITSGVLIPSSCGNDASIALSATGGNTPNGYMYQYQLNNGSWQTASNPLSITPSATQQTINVRAVVVGNTNCYGTIDTFTIMPRTAPIVFVSDPSFVPPTTNSSSDGSIRVEITNGAPNYTYELHKLNSASGLFELHETISSPLKSIDFLNITTGNYSLTVTDANGCFQTANTIIVTKEKIPSLTANPISEITCLDSADGQVSAQIGEFNTNYTYQWIINGIASAIQTSSSSSLSLNNLNIGGTYILRTASGRIANSDFGTPGNYNEVSFSLAAPAEVMILSATPNNTSCNGLNDGSITLTLSGGTSYAYTLNQTDWNPFNGTSITNLAAGFYTITIRNENGCESQALSPIFIDEPDLLVISEIPNSRQNVSVHGGADGAVFIALSGGTAPFSFHWTGPNHYTSNEQNLNALSTGNYSVTVTDANGCSRHYGPIWIDEPEPLGITSLNAIPVSCKGEATGSITAVVSGLPPFQYLWSKDGDASFTAPPTATISNLTVGSYTLMLTDASGDPAISSTITVTEPFEALTAVATSKSTSCFNGNDGQIIISASGGTAPYQYKLHTGLGYQNNPAFSNLSSDTYSITIQDANGCISSITNLFIDHAPELNITTDLLLNVTEAGQSDGALYMTATGGSLSYTYQWSGPDGFSETSKDITNLAEGLYTLTVTDGHNCLVTETYRITAPEELVISARQLVYLECNGDNFAEIEVNVQGGVPNYSYQWFQITNSANVLLNENSNILAEVSVGRYYVIVTDANAVSRTSTTLTVTEPDSLNAILSTKTDVLCSTEQTGSIELSVSGGTTPYKFYWNGEETTQNLSNLSAGAYFFEVVDANGCFDQLEVTIEGPVNPLMLQEVLVTNVSSYQANDGRIDLQITGGAPNYTIEWKRLSDNASISNQTTMTNLSADSYQIAVTDANGCIITEVYEITQPDSIEETISTPTCVGEANGSIRLLVNKGNGNFTYTWNTGQNTSAIYNLAAGEYTVTITGFAEPLTRTYRVEDPLPIIVNLGDDKVLCVGQEIAIDATVSNPSATYSWSSDNGFTSTASRVVLSEKGTYILTIQNENGCFSRDEIFVALSDEEIDAQFATSSQVYVGETLVLVDISYPLPERIEWIIPENATIQKKDTDEAEIVFDTPGEFEIGIITQKGSCTAIQTKKVLVLAKDPAVSKVDNEGGKKIVEDFILYPNPTSGIFNAAVKMSEIGPIRIQIFSFANNSLIATEKARGKSTYTLSFNLSTMPAGVYAVLLETPFGSTLRKIIIK